MIHLNRLNLKQSMSAARVWHFVLSLAVIGAPVGTPPAIACEYPDAVPPAQETRRYENSQLGLAFQIPANYRAVGMQGGNVSIMNPSSYVYIQCITRVGYGEGGWFSSLDLSLEAVPAGSRGLEQTIRANSPWITGRIQLVTEAGKEFALYGYTDEHDDILVMNVSYFTADRRQLVTLSGPYDDPVFQQAIATLELR
jgi:hypothetical protein